MNAVLLDTSVASLFHPKKKRAEDRAEYEPHMLGQVLAHQDINETETVRV